MVTIKTVAQHAGVSPSTVSRVLGDGSAYVASETRERVLKAIEELHYVPNINAQSLRKFRTNNIALLIPDIFNDSFPPIIQGIEDYTRKNNYNIILCITHDDLELERYYIESLKRNKVDGFLICSMTPRSKAVYQLRREGIPTVLIARHYSDEIDAVVVDNYEGAFNGVSYLLNTGKKRIAVISGSLSIPLYQQRLDGYKNALKAAGIPVDEQLIVYENGNKNTLCQTIENMVESCRPDAIFATSDEKAMIAMRAVDNCGLRIPEDVAVLGFDNIKMSTLINPPLSTVSQPFFEMGNLATRRLIEKIAAQEEKAPVVDVVETELIIRASTG